MSYVSGKGIGNTHCDVCGFQFKTNELRKRWDGNLVCEDDWETRHPQEFIKVRGNDPRGLPNSRPKEVDLEDYTGYIAYPPLTWRTYAYSAPLTSNRSYGNYFYTSANYPNRILTGFKIGGVNVSNGGYLYLPPEGTKITLYKYISTTWTPVVSTTVGPIRSSRELNYIVGTDPMQEEWFYLPVAPYVLNAGSSFQLVVYQPVSPSSALRSCVRCSAASGNFIENSLTGIRLDGRQYFATGDTRPFTSYNAYISIVIDLITKPMPNEYVSLFPGIPGTATNGVAGQAIAGLAVAGNLIGE